MTKQRQRAKYQGKYYRLVPWLKEGDCDGCVFQIPPRSPAPYKGCPNDTLDGEPCDAGNEYSGMIFIECGKEALAKYIAQKLEMTNDEE